MKDIRLGNMTLPNGETVGFRHYAGGDRTLVLVHGNLASSKFFDELIQKLPEGFTVYAPDLRGSGLSTYNNPIDDLRDFAGDLRLFVDQLGLTTFDLLGWSMGGAVSLLFASSYGYMVERLFLICPIPVSGYDSFALDGQGNRIQLKTREEIKADVTKKKLVKAVETSDKEFYRKLWSSAIYNKKQPEQEIFEIHVDETLRQRSLMDVYYAVAKYNMTDSFNGVSMGTGEISRIQVPTIIMQGEDDLLVSVEAARFTKESIGQNAELLVWDECGHSPFVDRLDELAACIARN